MKRKKKEDLLSLLFKSERTDRPLINITKRGFTNVTRGSTYHTYVEADVTGLLSNKLVSLYQKRMVKRMKGFYDEARRMNTKVNEVFGKLKELGIIIDKSSVEQAVAEKIINKRKKPKVLIFHLVARKDTVTMNGSMRITPASLRLTLVANNIYYKEPIYQVNYYRKMYLKDNFLTTLVNGSRSRSYVEAL